jgi:molybdopterin converting factor small subunit
MATIIIPTPLRKFTNQKTRLDVDGANVKEAIEDLTLNFPDLKKHLIDDNGKLRTFVNIFVGDDDIRDLNNENTEVKSGSVLSIIPAIAGGSI